MVLGEVDQMALLDSTDQKQEEKSKKGNKEGGGMHQAKGWAENIVT